MTAIHLAAKNGHVNVLEALKEHVSFKVTSTKVSNLNVSDSSCLGDFATL